MPQKKPGENPPSISPAEWEVIETLWDHGPLAARDAFAALPADRNWAYKTVKTLLARLVAKGAVDYEQIGNSYLYRAVYSREEVTREEVKGFVDRVLGGSLSGILAHFIQHRNLSDEEINQLQELLEKKKPSGQTAIRDEARLKRVTGKGRKNQ